MNKVRYFFLILLLIYPASLSALEGAPSLKIETPVYDFGEVSEGTVVEYSFKLANAGEGPLRITRVQAACGCTAAQPEVSELSTGESTSINATFDTRGFGGYTEKRIQVYTNDPTAPFTLLEFRGTIKPEVLLTPTRVYFGQVRKGKEEIRSLEILAEKDSGIEIRDVIARSEGVTLNAEDYSKGNQAGKKVTLKLNKDLPVGVYKTRLSVRTTSKKTPVINVPVFARIVGDLELEPADASFGLIEGPLNEPASRVLRLENRADFPVRVLSVESTTADIKADFETIREGRNYSVTVTAREGFEGTIRSKVNIITNHPDDSQKTLTFSVYGIVTKKGL